MVEAIVTGFMGSGKTTIGKLLANGAHRRHLDLDDLIVQHASKTINQIFAEHGEAYFRVLETELLSAALGQSGVLSTGGGTIGNEKNQQLLGKNEAPVIYLKTSFESIIERLNGDQTRPLVQKGTEALKDLYQRRRHDYEQSADLVVVTDDKSPEQIVNEIQQSIRL